MTFERCDHIEGPFYHGTRTALDVGDGNSSPAMVRTTTTAECPTTSTSQRCSKPPSGAELATALAGNGERGHIYVVEPTGPFEDDPNVTNKVPRQHHRVLPHRDPLRILAEVRDWEGHPPEVLQGMLDNIALACQGLDVIED
ncbi:MAG: NAD(+)--rifampin ADP-ribosyltransferase [Microthrixaceae bacterium]